MITIFLSQELGLKIMSLIISILIYAGTTFGLFLSSLLLFIKKGNLTANRFLGVFFAVFSISILIHMFKYTGVTKSYSHFYMADAWIPFLYGPLIFIHTKASLNLNIRKKLKKNILVHFFPAFVFLLYLIPFYFLTDVQKLNILNRKYVYFSGDRLVYSMLQNIHILAYLVSSGSIVYRSQNKSSKHIWLAILIGNSSLIVLLAILKTLTGEKLIDNWIIPFLGGFFFLLSSYIWMLFPEIFTMEKIVNALKYNKSGLKEEDLHILGRKLVELMDDEKLYLKPNISLKLVAGKLKIHQNQLSQILSTYLNTTWFDFINKYRIQEAKSLLTAEIDLSITDIAYKVGYNSKSTFYNAFKKEMGCTPTEFIKRST